MQLLLTDIANLLGCSNVEDQCLVTGMVIDSRQVKAGDLFVALKGEHQDGHAYLASAREAGAVAALVSELQDDDLPQLLVEDVSHAFGLIAAFWRKQYKGKVLAVTGSNGKTTVKEMLASILSEAGNVIATQGNLNNELGVPLTLSRVSQDDDYAVIEMGTNHPGEIEYLANIVRPDVAIITNVGAAHLEGFISVDGVAKEKSSIYGGLNPNGTGIINADMAYAREWIERCQPNNTKTFGLDHDSDVSAHNLMMDASRSTFMLEMNDAMHFITLPLPGRHNVANALAAIAASQAIGISAEAIVKGLAKMKAVPHRLQMRNAVNGAKLIDDSYNANPNSYAQALKVLATHDCEHWLVLGDFGELGTDGDEIHAQLGRDAKQSGVQRLFTIGKASELATNAFGDGAQHYTNMDELEQSLTETLHSNVTCLIKGSHFMRLDKLADKLAKIGEA
jgi:UDP-N-acetylmuramoyl-tripeptide--D-alanyl-D-alanine ligase